MEVLLFFLLMYKIGITVSLDQLKCTTHCEEGEYCNGATCLPCNYGFFREEKLHRYLSCKPWTQKSTSDHWELISNGTATKDHVWQCEAGYEHPYPGGEKDCWPAHPTVQTTTEKTTTTSAASSSTTARIDHSKNNSSDILGHEIAIIVLCLIAIFLNGSILFIIFRRKIFKCRSTFLNTEPVNNNNTAETVGLTEIPVDPPTLHYRDVFKYFNRMGICEGQIFLRILPDPSGSFIAPNEYSFKINDTLGDAINALISTCQKWALKNPGLDYQSIFKKTLKYMKRNDLLENETDTLLEHDLLQEKSSPRQIFNILSYFLTNNLTRQDFDLLFLRLSPTNNLWLQFKRQNFVSNCKDISLSDIDTLVEWWNLEGTQDTEKFIETFTDLLGELERNDIIENPHFQSIIDVYRETTNVNAGTTQANGASCATPV
ncbi:uncharacterized protein LOC131948321 [Physella acuta]|uniref:uncharacterized protein LOC131948321 n=1 Tax=Physella acuta TaxID=109671 RepID=UPI0027DC6A46|nr:uncharacterized protein LOC131948321 [Physella acuta]